MRRFPWLLVAILLCIVVTAFGVHCVQREKGAMEESADGGVVSEQSTEGFVLVERERKRERSTVIASPQIAISASDEATLSASLSAARAAKNNNQLADARSHYLRALSLAGDSSQRPIIEEELADVSVALLTTPHLVPGKVDYTIQSGDHLRGIAATHGTTLELVQRSNGIDDPNRIRVGDRLRLLKNVAFSIEISKLRNDLVLRMNGEFIKRYNVGTGKYGKTPMGRFTIVDRIKNPVWWRPDGRAIPFGDKENILGTRWMKLEATGETPSIQGYGIHGTWENSSIGKQSSAGCIRMRNVDVEELFMIVPYGTAVSIVE